MKDIHELNEIIRILCKAFNITNIEAVFSNCRQKELVEVKRLFLFFAREKFSWNIYTNSFLERYINRKHSSLYHHSKKINDLIKYDKNYRILVETLRIEINEKIK